MRFGKVLLGAAMLFGMAVEQANAASYNIAFSLFGQSSPSYSGSFTTADLPGTLTVSNFNAVIDGITYDYVGLSPGWSVEPLLYDPAAKAFTANFFTQPYASTDPLGAGVGIMLFSTDPALWGTGTCAANVCPAPFRGNYVISAVSDVPIPAALLA